jgi:hypothetical protein
MRNRIGTRPLKGKLMALRPLLVAVAVAVLTLAGCAFLERHATGDPWSWCEPNCGAHGGGS